MPEQQVDRFRTSTLRWLYGSLAGLGTLALVAAGVIATVALGTAWPLAASALGVVLILVHWLRALSSLYEVTDQRLIVCHGLVMKTVDEIELYRVKDIRLDFSVLGQMAGIGTITLTSTDRTTGDTQFVLPDVPQARDRREGLRGLIERARQRRGVRELDLDHEGFQPNG
ncbi:PH domain-containing protein [Sphingomonas sp.]|uniref:PH domain-containing protein n=1 Tax=Sphingomonas sp. TaxID=28214 RepID=UPI003AFFEED0